MTRFSYTEYFSLFHSCPAPSRSAVSPESAPTSAPKGLFQEVMQKYNRSKSSQLAPVDPVLKAIKEDDEEALTAMIKAGKNLSEPNKEGWLPLHEAAYYGQLNCLKALHRAYPAVIDQRTLQEETALYLATCRGHVDCLQFLLQAGAEPDISNKSRETPLYKACERKNVEAVRILVQYKADTNHRCNRGWTALHESVARNDLEVMEILVSGGAKVEAKNAYGITPLFVAAQSGQLEALRFLAKYGADINTQASDSASALYEACKNGHEEVVEFLLSQGADANKTNKDGMLPLHIASKKGNYRTSKTPGSSLPAASSKGHWEIPHQTPGHVAASRQADQIPEIREHPVTRAHGGGAAAPQTVSLSLRTAVSPNPGDPGTDVAGSRWALRYLWARALPRAEDSCVEQEKNRVGFHLDEEIPDLLCHWEWQKAPFLGPGGRTRVELGVVGGRQGGRQQSPDPTSRLWLESFLSGVILSLLGHLLQSCPVPLPLCSVKLST